MSKNKFIKNIINIISLLFSFIKRFLKIILYVIIGLVALFLMFLPFLFPEDWQNASNISFGLGTGMFTSLIVTVIINAEVSAREKQRIKKEKMFLLNDIIVSSLDVYEDIVYRINEYITLSQLETKEIYELYTNFKKFDDIEEHLKKIDINQLSETERSRLEKLFNFQSHRIDYLVSALKHLSKQDYYLRGILTETEYRGLLGNTATDKYIENAKHSDVFWKDEIINFPKCIVFLKMTIYVASITIHNFDFASKKAKLIDNNIKNRIAQLWFDEIYSQSEEYILSQQETEDARWEYYAEHQDEIERLLDEQDKTEEDYIIEELARCIYAFSPYDINDLLGDLDKNSIKVRDFFSKNDIQKEIKKNRKIKVAINNKYGKGYLKEIRIGGRK